MLARMWRTGVDPSRVGEYERFASSRSLPMFRAHRGCLEVLFLRSSADSAAVLTVWEDPDAIVELEASELYRETVAAILAAGFLTGPQTVEVYEITGGTL
jgi:heme-degrading monooxygenase HmoA